MEIFERGDLTERELEIIIYRSNFSIADTAEFLGISENTVKTELSHAFRKLGVQNEIGALNECVKRGYFDWEDVGSPKGGYKDEKWF